MVTTSGADSLNRTLAVKWNADAANEAHEWEVYLGPKLRDIRFRIVDDVTKGYIGRRIWEPMEDGKWYTLAATYGGCGLIECIRLWKNAVQSENGPNSAGTYIKSRRTDAPFSIGHNNGSPSSGPGIKEVWNGKIALVLFTHTELNNFQIFNLHRLVNGFFELGLP